MMTFPEWKSKIHVPVTNQIQVIPVIPSSLSHPFGVHLLIWMSRQLEVADFPACIETPLDLVHSQRVDSFPSFTMLVYHSFVSLTIAMLVCHEYVIVKLATLW